MGSLPLVVFKQRLWTKKEHQGRQTYTVSPATAGMAGTPDRTRGWEEPERECSTCFQPALPTPNQASSPYKSHFSLFKLCMVEIISD